MSRQQIVDAVWKAWKEAYPYGQVSFPDFVEACKQRGTYWGS